MKKTLKSLWYLVDNYSIYILLIVFLALFCGRSLLTHYSFNSHSWDLGIYTQQTWLYSNFVGAYNTVRGTNLLSDHFGPILSIFAPIFWIFPKAETILIIQALLVVASGYPLYLIGKKLLKSGLASTVIVFAYLSSSGIRQAIDFDFHLATIAVFFYGFFVYFWFEKKYLPSIIFAFLAIICKEDVPLFVAFAALSFLLRDIKNKQNFKYSLWLLLGSVASFLAIFKIMLLIPATSANANYFSFSNYGSSYGDVLKNFIANPITILKRVWFDFSTNTVKVSTFKTYFGGFWYLPLVSIDIMILSIPFLITKFVSDRWPQWGLNGQYAVIGMFVLALATIFTIARLTRIFKSWQKPLVVAWSLVFLVFLFNYNVLDVGGNFWNVVSLEKWRNTRQFDSLREVLQLIPKDASVAAQEQIVPHLAARKEIYVLNCSGCLTPETDKFDYIVLDDRFYIGLFSTDQGDVKSFVRQEVESKRQFEIISENHTDTYSTYLLKNLNPK